MAKQIGLLKITGTIDGICFYRMDGVYYARQKSSLSGERVKHDPAFAGTMRCAKGMGTASKIASVLYRQIVPPHERSRDKFREVVSMVKRELDREMDIERSGHCSSEAGPRMDASERRLSPDNASIDLKGNKDGHINTFYCKEQEEANTAQLNYRLNIYGMTKSNLNSTPMRSPKRLTYIDPGQVYSHTPAQFPAHLMRAIYSISHSSYRNFYSVSLPNFS